MAVPKTLSIRSTLLLILLVLVFLVSITILIIIDIGARRTVRDLSQRFIEQTADQAQAEMRHFFGSIEGLLDASRAWWTAGLLDYENRANLERLNAVFIPLLDRHRQITSMMLVQDEGLEYLLFRDLRGGDDYEWYNRLVWADHGPEAGYEVLWTRDLALYSEGPLPAEARDYDPRRRRFYMEPVLDQPHWTAPYYFFTTKDAGMTVAYKWHDQASGQIRLVAFDLLLMDLSSFTAKLRPSPNGKVFVLHPNGSLIGLPADARWPNPEAIRDVLQEATEYEVTDRGAAILTPQDLGLTVVRDAVSAWRGDGEDLLRVFRYESDDGFWWGGFRLFNLQGQALWIGVMVPEADFLGEALRQRNLVLAVTAGALFAAVLLAGAMARHYSRPLEFLAKQSVKVRDLDLTAGPPVRSRVREIAQLAEAQSQMMSGIRSFARYVPIDVVRELVRRGDVAKIGGKTAPLSVLFTDVQDFTRIAEGMTPDELTHHMADYFRLMIEALQSERATVDKLVGDAIVAFWGAPEAFDNHAEHAVSAVLKCRALLRDQNAQWQKSGLPALRTRFGLCTGHAVVGNVGAPERLSYTALGDTVNMASRLEALNARYGTEILATESVVDAVGTRFVWRRIDRVTVKGKALPTDIYEPLGEVTQVSEAVRDRAADYEEALRLSSERRFADAVARLDSLLAAHPDDEPSIQLREKCRQWIKHPPPRDWDGVTHHSEK